MPRPILYLLFLTLIFTACHQREQQTFVSLKVYKEYDSTRNFDTTSKSKNIYRPVRIDVFYPSTEKPLQASLTYGNLVDMYEQRFNYNTPIDACKKTSLDMATAFAGYFHVDAATKFLQYKTGINENLSFPQKQYPLVIYAASMNGSSWENAVLFDSLASHGYIVAAVSSVGKFPGFMSDAVDVNEQVQDILYTIQFMKNLPFIDGDDIGIASWSMGGTSAAKAAMLTKEIKCMLSFDGTDIHAYGDDTAWDREYNQIRAIPPYSPQSIDIPYMYLRSEHPKKVDSIYNTQALASSKDKYFLKFANAIHEDFSSLPVVAKQVQPSIPGVRTKYYGDISKLTLLFFDEYLKKEGDKNVGAYIDQLVTSDTAHYSSVGPKY